MFFVKLKRGMFEAHVTVEGGEGGGGLISKGKIGQI